jgi:hypothetical protein
MLAVAWSAADGAVSWGQRTRGLKPGNVSAAAVTTLERRAESAKDRPVLEYNVPNWLALPAVRATARRFIEDYQRGEAADAAYQEFARVLQRVSSRPTRSPELDDDLAEGLGDGPTRWDQDDESASRRADQTEKPFAVVTPAGELEIRSATDLAGVRAAAGEPHGLAEHVLIVGIDWVAAVVPVFIDHATHPENAVAAGMLSLLGAGPDGANGHVAFYQTDGHNQFVALDDDVRQLIQAAYETVRAQITAATE